MNFIGQYRHIIDNKNRFFLPAKIRKGKKTLIITSGQDGCLYIYTAEIWGKLIDKFENLPLTNKSEKRSFKRAFLASAKEVQIDGLGRILIPYDLKEEAKISRKIVIVGVGERLEIWSDEIWEKYYLKAKQDFRRLANRLEI